MMNILKPAFLATALIASSYVSAAQQTAPAFVKGVADQLTERLNTDRAKYKKDLAYLRTIVQEDIIPYVDFDGFAKGVMGRYYRQASPAQIKQFQANFRGALVGAYSKYLAEYDNESYTVRPYQALKDPTKAVVTMDFKTDKGQVVPVSYMLIDQGGWKIRNLKIEGIDVGLTFRKQFSSAVEANRGNLDKAIKNFVPKQPA